MRRFTIGLVLAALAAILPMTLASDADAAVSYTCTMVQQDRDAVFTFEGADLGTSANLRSQQGWVATVTDMTTYTVDGGAEGSYYVKLNSKHVDVDCQDVTVKPAPDLTCSTLIDGDDEIAYLWGSGVGATASLFVDGDWSARITGQTSHRVADAGNAVLTVWLPASRTKLDCDAAAPTGYSCTSLTHGNDARLFFWGNDVSSTSANVLDSSGWLDTVTGVTTYVSVDGANENHIVKLHRLRTAVRCDNSLYTGYQCTVTTNGDVATLRFSGSDLGTSANVLRNGTWIKTVTNDDQLQVANGAEDSFIVKLHGKKTAVACEPGEPMPFGQSGDWTLDFADEFDGTELNLDNWEPVWFDNGGFQRSVNGNEDACYHRDQVSVADGNLFMELSREDDPACQIKDGSRANYVGAQLTTRNSWDQDRYEFTEGYIEARMFLPSSNGDLHNWPAFWVNGRNWPTQGEIDIMEGLRERQPCASFHYSDANGDHKHKKTCPQPAWDNPGGWHIFAAEWAQGAVTFYYDGVELGSAPAGTVTNEPHYISLQYTARADWGGVQLDSALVDYVRVWQSGD